MSIDLEYAIKQDVKNNPVVREVDRDQRREFLRTLMWTGLAVAMLIFALAPHANLVSSGYRIEDLRDDVAVETEWQRHLRLELAMTLRPQELERRATRELHMLEPAADDVVVIVRAPAASPANRAIVAAVR